MSLAFLGFLPFAMGFITIFVVERREPQPVWIWLLLPWVPVLGASFEGVGGVRHASFERGVLFIETVDAWEPERRLAFSIHAQSDQIPPTTLDEHVRVGGPFFDGLRGEYTLEPLPNGATRLRLSSRRRISTDLNWYAHLWSDAVMADLQGTILRVVHQRCEAEAGGQSVGNR